MLSEVTRISKSENQLQYLNKIYNWAFQEKGEVDINFDIGEDSTDKHRPGTASTKTRSYSAYTKARPESSKQPDLKKPIEPEIKKATMDKYPQVDFKQLKHGEKYFFLGHRTLHPEEERPRVKLK